VVSHRVPRHTPVTGPKTEAQLVALRSLEGLSIQQASPVPELSLPPAMTAVPGGTRPGSRVPWQLVCVLAVQALLTLRLVWSNTAFQDEALYLWAGHMEWAHWLHGAPIPSFASWFSGAPVLYPALGAAMDAIGGLTAARLLSLLLMLFVTCFLWGTTRRLVSNRAGFVAVALFATLPGTAFLGALATYDALALFLLTGATWFAVRGIRRGQTRAVTGYLLAGVILGMACAVKYAAAIFVPLILIVVALAAWRIAGRRRAVLALLGTFGGVVATLAALLALGGHAYWEGILVTTLNRPPSTSSPFTVFKLSYIWTALIAVLAVLSLFLSRTERPIDRWLLAVLAAAILLVPIEQARVDTTVSLQKHVVFGAWFAAMAAGYGLAKLSVVDKTKGWAVVAAIPILAVALLDGIPQASNLFAKWPNVSPILPSMPGLYARFPGNYLTSSYLYQVLGYYSRGQTSWAQWQGDLTFSTAGAAPGLASDRIAIKNDYFSLIIIETQRTSITSTDESVLADMRQAGGYRMVASAGGFEAWAPVEES
jgi:hypothetical protein